MSDGPAENTDVEIWRERPGDYYADSIHVTADGSIGIDCGGYVFVMPVRGWHRLASGWQPIETAPKDGTHFWAFEEASEEKQYVCWWKDDFSNWEGWTTTWDDEPNPTHWQPLPPPPSTTTEQ